MLAVKLSNMIMQKMSWVCWRIKSCFLKTKNLRTRQFLFSCHPQELIAPVSLDP